MANVCLSRATWVMPDACAQGTLAIRAGRIDASPMAGAYQVDLAGHVVFPGLINAHDHLHINAVPALRAGAPFPNSYAWIEAFQAHFEQPDVMAALQVPKALRLRHGALKNLLAGTTCVVHHDPWHDEFDAADFPVAVLRDYGWSYAPGWPDYGPPVQSSFAATPSHQPWIIHLAEGTDAVAQAELMQLDRLGCVAANSVLVHGVGMSEQDIERVIERGAAVVWCPASNHALLGYSLDPHRLCAAGRLALGSDSRLSGARDLLDELRFAQDRCVLGATELLGLVTHRAASILRLHARGSLSPGAVADLVIVADHDREKARNLVGIERSALRAVIRNGVPQIADPDFSDWFAAAEVETVPVLLDGKPKLLAKSLADPSLLALEPGLEWAGAWRASPADALADARCH